jgi:hypothetical protein
VALVSLPAWLAVGRGEAPAEKELPAPKVICSALEVEGLPDFPVYYSSPFVDVRRPELVVLGKIRTVERGKFQDTYQIDVEKVLAGSWNHKTLIVDGIWAGERDILSLVQTGFGEAGTFHVRWTYEVGEEKAVQALYAARLDYHTLAAACIFIGKEVAVVNQDHRTVEVVKPIAGDAPEAGRRVTVSGPSTYWPRSGKRLVEEPVIYFIPVIGHDPKRMPGEEVKGPVYHFDWRQPLEQEVAIRAALKRRDVYPIREAEENGKKVRYREVLFRGSTADAIEMLGSFNKALVVFGSRKLIHDGPAAHAGVLAALEPRLLRTSEEKRGDFRLLHNLIKILDTRNKTGTSAALNRLLDRYLEHVAQGPPEPEGPSREWGRYSAEEENLDVNHALTWLLQQCDLETVHRRYGLRLLQVRDKVKGRWKQEVQLALDVCRIEDQIELEAALARMKGVKPVHTQLAIKAPETNNDIGIDADLYRQRRGTDFFFADKDAIRTLGHDGTICLWDTTTLRLRSRLALPASLRWLSARPSDGRYLLCRGKPVPGRPATHVVDAETGHVVSSPALPDEIDIVYSTGIYWANEPEAIFITGKKAVRFDYLTGKVLRETACEKTPGGWGGAALSADGALLHWIETTGKGTNVEIHALNLTTGKAFEIGKNWRLGGYDAGVVPGGKYFHIGPHYLLDRRTLDVVAEKRLRGFSTENMVFAADGSRAAVITDRHSLDWQSNWPPTGKTIRILDVPSLKTIGAIGPVPGAHRLRFAPDGQRLAVLNKDDSLEVWDLSVLAKP